MIDANMRRTRLRSLAPAALLKNTRLRPTSWRCQQGVSEGTDRARSIGMKHFVATTGLALLLACAPSSAATITLTPQTYGFYDPSMSNHFELSPIHAGPGTTANFAEVGRENFGYPTGDYAATIEFLIPTLPIDATLSSLSLTIATLGGNIIHDVQLRSYFAATTGPDPDRIFAGSNLTNNLNLNPSVVTTDLIGTPTVNYLEDNPGQYLGFSFRETNPTNCPEYACNSVKTIGSTGDPDYYTLPVLTFSYDVPAPPPPSAPVPEPSSWTMMLGGFGCVGGAMRRRRKAEVFG